MTQRTAIILALSGAIGLVSPALPASPDAWTELFRRASVACVKASELKAAKADMPIDFSDKVLVIVNGHWPQPHMKNKPARFACLYDKRAQTVEANEISLGSF